MFKHLSLELHIRVMQHYYIFKFSRCKYDEELSCDEVEKVIHKRLESGEKPTLSYGKLMERILYFRFCKNATTPMDRDGKNFIY